MKKVLLGLAAMAVAATGVGVIETWAGGEQKQKPATAQQEQAQKQIEGKIKSVDPSGSKITLEDGTQLQIPSTAAVPRGALKAGAAVAVLYVERDGQKIVTAIQPM